LTHTETDQLRRSLERALDQQAATSDILRAMSGSPAEVQPVFDAIVRSGLRLLHGYSASMMLLREGGSLDLVAYTSTSAEADASLVHVFPMPLRTLPPGERAVRDRRPHAVEDVAAAADVSDVMRETGRRRGWHANLFIPMLREDVALGLISITRRDPGPFAADEIALLETFAAQAVIAIENVRLFNELEAANRQLAAASRHKSEFLANMSHELRTPMNAILGFSEVLSEHMFGDLNEKQEEYLKDIHAAGQHLLSLINDILDLSKVEAGRMELELADFDLPTALGNTVMLVRERAGRRGITVETVLDGRLGEVRGDERKVRQVTLNLLSNAIKFTPEGGRIEVTAVPGEACVEVSVRDTGVGIAPEDQEKVFEEFRQVGTADKKVEGTGLGLALSRKFVELHGGRIWVTSEIGRGSTFTFTLPVPGAVSRPA
jgi:signal transduction histidine kinase